MASRPARTWSNSVVSRSDVFGSDFGSADSDSSPTPIPPVPLPLPAPVTTSASAPHSAELSTFVIHSREVMLNLFDPTDGTSEPLPQLNKLQFCFKLALCASNLVFMIFGVILIAAGASAVSNQDESLAGATPSTGVIAMGVFVFAMSLLGAASAWKESRIFLCLYFCLVLPIALVLLVVGVVVYVIGKNGETYVRQGWASANMTDPDALISIEMNLHCCGLDRVNDTLTAPCPYPDAPPCAPLLIQPFKKATTTAGACAIAFAVIMVFGVTFVCCLMVGIKNKSAALRMQQRRRQEAREFDRRASENDEILTTQRLR